MTFPKNTRLTPSPSLTIFGAGSFGTALAETFQKSGFSCCLWGRNDALMQTIKITQKNTTYLPTIPLNPDILYTSDLHVATAHSQHWIMAIKAPAVPGLMHTLSAWVTKETRVIIAAKGFDNVNDQLLHHALTSIVPYEQILALSGPSFAIELAAGQQTALVLAGQHEAETQALAVQMTTDTLRVYPSHDVTGVLFGGAFKNILAIGAGIVEGACFGENARAALVCRGFHEMCQLADKMGADKNTLFGLSGLGDLSLTAMSAGLSRNKKFGLLLGQGLQPAEALEKVGATIEGISSVLVACALGQKHDIPLPITQEIAALIAGEKTCDAVMNTLMNRPLPSAEWIAV